MSSWTVMVCLVLAAEPAVAQPQVAPWEVVTQGPVRILARKRAGSPVREIRAEGVLRAPARAIQEVLTDTLSFPRWMPYVKQTRYLGGPRPDGSHEAYTRWEFPLIAPRDVASRSWVESFLDAEGGGVFLTRWRSDPTLVPVQRDLVRIPQSEGSWEVRGNVDGSSRVVYEYLVNPGGWVPSFAADLANQSAIGELFQRLEQEANLRAPSAADGGVTTPAASVTVHPGTVTEPPGAPVHTAPANAITPTSRAP